MFIILSGVDGIDSDRLKAQTAIDAARAALQTRGERMRREQEWDWYRLDKALEKYLDAVQIGPTVQHAWTGLAYVLHLVGAAKLAQMALKRSYELACLGPNHPGRVHREASAAINSGSYLAGGQVSRPPLPGWFWARHGHLLSGDLSPAPQ